jgi:hypothetical protein
MSTVVHRPIPFTPARSVTARARWPLVASGLGAAAVPLIVALVAARSPQWYPVLDRAGFELRMRDVGGDHSPLVGVVARLEGYGQQGNHPGPLSFYLMWPAYRAFGATAWSLQVAVAGFQLMAVGVTLWLAARRGGERLALGVLVTVAIVARGVGVDVLIDPWNPFLSLLWWLAFVLAVWSLVEGDLPVLPVAAVAGSICGQNHLEYVPLVAGLGGLAVVALAARVWRRRRREESGPTARAALGWVAAAGAAGAVLWVPPLLDEVRRTPGNLAILVGQFRQGSEPSIGLGKGVQALLVHADPIHLVRGTVVGDYHVAGSALPGAALLAVAGATAVVAWRLGHRPLLRLHAVLGAAFVVGAVTMSRIIGPVWFWLGLWGAVLAALTVLAIAWTLAAAAARRYPAVRRRATVGLAAVGGVLLLTVTAGSVDAEPSGEELADKLSGLAPPTIAALDTLDDRAVAGRDPRDRVYLVTFTDPVNLGMHVFGLVNELERAGYDVGMTETHRASVGAHRVLEPGEATGEIHLAVGQDIERWRRHPGVRELTYLDGRTPREAAEYDRLHDELVADLRRTGRADLVGYVDTFLLAVALDPDVPAALEDKAERMVEIGLPTAVFLAPVAPHL